MCGIAGLWDRRGAPEERLRALTRAMTTALAHRGPDASGVWLDPRSGVGLGHRRLSIIDLSETGAQPMTGGNGRFVITYNGELYNMMELKAELEVAGERFRGTSDTEVLLAAVSRFGLDNALKRFVGMFAFALWDAEKRSLYLVRDRVGKKPLFWSRQGEFILFGSELKALMRHPDFRKTLNRDAVAAYLRFAYVPSPHAIFEGVEKVPPATIIECKANGEIDRRLYWDLAGIAERGLSAPRNIGSAAAREEADALLRDAVRKRLISDVPLGALLSGGIDSSLVTALMQAQSPKPVRTFSVGFAERGYDESSHARAVAQHLGTEHTEMIVTPDDALAVVPKLPEWYDEPFSDSSQIPTHLISAIARKDVTVALSGDGGDEIAAGYVRHSALAHWWPRIAAMPLSFRRAAATMLSGSPALWDGAAALLPASRRPAHLGDKAQKLAALLLEPDADEAYRSLVSQWPEPAALLPETHEPPSLIDDPQIERRMPNMMGRLQYFDMAGYMTDDILAKVDRASMAVALEVRCPLLDHRVIEMFWSLPRELLAGAGGRKIILRAMLSRYLPRALFERPKMGFGVPIEFWLRGPLRDWAECLIADDRLRQEGLFDPAPIRAAWNEHQSGRRNHQYRLWNVLMFQAWRERWLDSPTPSAPTPELAESARVQ